MFDPELDDVDEIPDGPLPALHEVIDLEPAAVIPPVVAEPADPVLQLEPKVGAMARLIASTKAIDHPSYLVVCEQTKAIKLLIAEVDATFDPLVKNARTAVDEAEETLRNRKTDLAAVREKRAKHRGPLEDAERANKAEIARYVDERDRAIKAAADAQAAAEKRQADAAAEQRAKDITQLADAGKADEAAALAAMPLPQPTMVVTPKAQAEPPKATGISTSKVPKATVTDLRALIVGVADKLLEPEKAGPPLDVLTVGKAKLNAWATGRLSGPLDGFDGIDVTNASAAVSDFRALVLCVAAAMRSREVDQHVLDVLGLGDLFEVVPSVLNKWTTAQGTALNWPGVSVGLVTEVSASRRG